MLRYWLAGLAVSSSAGGHFQRRPMTLRRGCWACGSWTRLAGFTSWAIVIVVGP